MTEAVIDLSEYRRRRDQRELAAIMRMTIPELLVMACRQFARQMADKAHPRRPDLPPPSTEPARMGTDSSGLPLSSTPYKWRISAPYRIRA